MTVFIVGGTGFIGKNTIESLLNRGINIKVFVRNQEKYEKILSSMKVKSLYSKIEPIYDDIFSPETYIKKLENIDAIINLVGIIREYPKKDITFEKAHYEITKTLVDVSLKLGIKRFIQMSALGASIKSKSNYMKTKYRAERYVIESTEEWTILRPSIVIGKDGEFTKMISNMIKTGIVPIPGDGNYKIKPISVTTLANFISFAVTSKETIKKEYNLVGPKEYAYNEFIDSFAKAIGKRNYIKIYIPIWLIRVSSAILGNLSPITKEQLELLLQGSTYEFDDLKGIPIKNIPIEEELKNI